MDTDGASKSYSCLTCRQRKVKCDKRNPCSNCVKAEKPCSFVQPVRGKRKRTKAPREGLHAKLKRYEEMLKAYGAKIEPSDDLEDDGYESGTLSHEPDVEMDENSEPRVHDPDFGGSFVLEETKPHLVTKDGTSRYFDRYVENYQLSVAPDARVGLPWRC